MAIIRNAANTIMKGRVGETTYYVSLGRQVARQRLNNSNYGKDARRTESQQSRRVRWANLVNVYKISKFWQPKAYETLRKGQTDYNRFMQLNVPISTISLTKQLAESGAAIIMDYLVSQGSLPSIETSKTTTGWTTNIALGGLEINEETTVAGFSKAVVDNNDTAEIGMQLSFVSYMQYRDGIGVPRLICTLYEVTLDLNNGNKMRDYMPAFCSQSLEGMLATSDEIAVGAFAYIWSSQIHGRIEVSTQRLIVNNSDLIREYSSASNEAMAIESYGLDAEVILSPLTVKEQGSTARPMYIQYITIGGTLYNNGDVIGSASTVFQSTVMIYLSFDVTQEEIAEAIYTTYKGHTGNISPQAQGGNAVKLVMNNSPYDEDIKTIRLTLKDGTEMSINFAEDTEGEDLGE